MTVHQLRQCLTSQLYPFSEGPTRTSTNVYKPVELYLKIVHTLNDREVALAKPIDKASASRPVDSRCLLVNGLIVEGGATSRERNACVRI